MSWMGAWFGAEEIATEVPAQTQASGGGGPDGIPFDAPHRAVLERRSREKLKRQIREEVFAEINIAREPRAVVEQDAESRRASPVAESLAPAVSDSGNAGVAPGLERASPQLVLEVTAPAQQQTAAVDLERARIAAKRRQQRELEQIMTVLMMAA